MVWVSTIARADSQPADASGSSAPSVSSTTAVKPSKTQEPLTPEQTIARHLALGKALLEQGAYTAAQSEFRAILELDVTHRDALRFMTKAQQQIDAQRSQTTQTQAHLRSLAEDLAVKVAREKASERAKQDVRSQQQLAQARERQLKQFYTRGLALYRQGRYEEAIDVFQQMIQVDPAHPLVRDAQQLIARAETRQSGLRARAATTFPIKSGIAPVPELEQQLIARKIEIEATLKFAKVAIKEHNHEMAIGLLQHILAEDPQHHAAQQLLEQEQLARLKDQEQQLEARVQQDEQSMVNEVVKAQLLPEPKPTRLAAPSAQSTLQAMSAKLREPISFDFTDVALGDVLEFIADGANLSIIPSPQLDLKSRRVSMKVTQLPLELALKYLAKNQSLVYRMESDAILIGTTEEFAKAPMETRVFFLRSGLGPFALETSAVQANPVLTSDPIKVLLEKSIPQPPGSKLVIDERSGALVMTNTAENMNLVERLLSQLDVAPVQVLIEARFIEVDVTELQQLGLEGVLTGDYALSKAPAGPSGQEGQGNIVAKGSGIQFSNLTRQAEGGNITLEGVLTAFQFESVLHALAETTKSKTLSAPRVTTLNNQTATIRVAEEFNYPTKYEVKLVQFDLNGNGDYKDAGETQFVNVPENFQKRDVGILLNVTPSVGKDMKTITLVLAPEVSQAGAFRDLGGGVSVPDFTSSQLTTSVVVHNGETVVLGGLMKDTTSEQLSKIPVLGDLPIIGGLFRQKQDTSERKNLLIFITARLLAPRGPTT